MLRITTRQLTSSEDLADCASLMMVANPWNRLYFEQEQCEESLAHRAITVYGAFSPEDEMVGFIAVMAEGIGLEPMIEYLCVAEEHRGKEVGTQLIEFFEGTLFPDADNLYMFVSDINPHAIRLYTRLGYTMVAALPNFNLEGQTEFLHRKSRRPVQEARATAARR